MTKPLSPKLLRPFEEAARRHEAEQSARIDWPSLSAETFVEDPGFCDLGISPGQRALIRAADGLPVTHLDPLDQEYFLGTRSVFQPPQRPTVIACRSGRRSGKSLIAMLLLIRWGLVAALRRPPEAHERAERDGLVGVGKGERVRLAVVAARMSQSLGTFELALARIAQSPRLRRYLVSKTATKATFERDDGQRIEVEILAAAPRGNNLRSGWFIGCVLDEADFFGEKDASITIKDQIDAVRPALVRGGQVWLCSSPWDDSGQFASIHAETFGTPSDHLAFHSSTQRMNPTCNHDEIELARARDPDFASREFDAVPMASGSDQWFPEASLVAACTIGEPYKREPDGAPHWAGSDPGLRKNSATLAIAGLKDSKVTLVFYEELVPPQKKSAEEQLEDRKKGVPPGLAPSVVFGSFARTALSYQCASIRGDQYYEDDAIEEMPKVKNVVGRSLWYDTFVDNADSTALIFTQFRNLMNEGRLALPNDPRLRQQLKDCKMKKGPSGKIHVALPRTGAAHGDLLKAVVLACVQVPLVVQAERPRPRAVGGSRMGGGRGF